jgi:hypothetical protein
MHRTIQTFFPFGTKELLIKPSYNYCVLLPDSAKRIHSRKCILMQNWCISKHQDCSMLLQIRPLMRNNLVPYFYSLRHFAVLKFNINRR